MNKEQIIDEVYYNYRFKVKLSQIPTDLTKEEFVELCKNDITFSVYWGLKIEERELTDVERYTIARQYGLCPKYSNIGLENCTEEEHYNKYNVPTKIITLTYNNEKIESYE